MRRFILAVMVCALLSGAVVAASALEPGDDAPVPEAAGGVGPGLPETPEREYCTPLGCVGVRTAHWSSVAGFAAAALAAGWLARRRDSGSGRKAGNRAKARFPFI